MATAAALASNTPEAVTDTLLASQSKLKNVDAQRILAVLQEAQRKIALMALLPVRMDARLTMVFGEEFSTLVNNHRKFEATYDQVRNSRTAQAQEIKECELNLHTSTRNLCRYMAQHSQTLYQKLRFLNTPKAQAVIAFEEKIQEMKTVLFERLRTTVDEERASLQKVQAIIAKEQRTNVEVKAFESELDVAKSQRSTEIDAKNDIIASLKESLRDIKHQAETTTKRMETRSKQKEELDVGQFQTKEKATQQTILQSRSQIETVLQGDREEEATLRKKKSKIENEVEAWISKYDQDMEEKQGEVDELTTIYLEEKANLDELIVKHREINAKWQVIFKERTAKAEIAKRKEEERALRDRSATKIQAVWRGYIQRKKQRGKSGKNSAGKKSAGKKGKKSAGKETPKSGGKKTPKSAGKA